MRGAIEANKMPRFTLASHWGGAELVQRPPKLSQILQESAKLTFDLVGDPFWRPFYGFPGARHGAPLLEMCSCMQRRGAFWAGSLGAEGRGEAEAFGDMVHPAIVTKGPASGRADRSASGWPRSGSRANAGYAAGSAGGIPSHL